MNYIINALIVIGFIGFFNFFALWIPTIYIRNSVKKNLKQAGYEKYDEIFAKSLLHQSISTSTKEESFFNKKEWPDIQSMEIKQGLINHKRLNSIAKWSFIGFIICYVLVMILSAIFNR